MIRNIIFDWSGTLVDDLPAVLVATNHVLERSGVEPMTLEWFRAEFALPFKGFYDRYTPHVPMEQLEAWFHPAFVAAQHQVTELPYARDFLQFCREQGVRMFLLSTLHGRHFKAQCEVNGFDAFLERAYTGAWDKRQKITELLGENGLEAERTLFIGDMQHDIETARHGGVLSCGVLTGYNKLGQLRQSEPDLIVQHLGELRRVLERSGMVLRRGQGREPLAPHPVATVGALIQDACGRLLMIRTSKWSGLWGIPGGKIKLGERAEDALRREILEETGLEIADVRLAMAQDSIHSEEFYRPAHFILLNYICRAAAGGGPVRLSDEAEEWRWCTVGEALGLPLNEPTRRLVEQMQKEGRI